MKNIFLILISLFIFIAGVSAKNTPVAGKWLLTKVEAQGEIHDVYSEVEFKSDGYAEMRGTVFGKWEYNKKAKTVTIESEMIKQFAGERKVSELNENEMVLTGSDEKLFFIKLDYEKIKADNEKSGLEGNWKINMEDGYKILSFKLPDLLSVKEVFGGGSSSLGSGTWICRPADKSIIIMVTDRELNGLNKVVSRTATELKLENGGNVIKAVKQKKADIKVERLTFSEEDFYNEDGDFKYYDDNEKLPWQDYIGLIENMTKIKQLVYNCSTLLDGTVIFETKKLTAGVTANVDDESVKFDNIFVGFDRESTPDDAEMPVSEFSGEPGLFPFDNDTYRVTGKEEITVPAGTFNCTVIEAAGNFNERIKLWMIDENPGVYAKVIRDKEGTFGHYIVFELIGIK